MADNQYLRFEERQQIPGRKTKQVDVYSTHHGDLLGLITWHGPWRQYCFMPNNGTIWNRDCLDTINEKIGDLMLERQGRLPV